MMDKSWVLCMRNIWWYLVIITFIILKHPHKFSKTNSCGRKYNLIKIFNQKFHLVVLWYFEHYIYNKAIMWLRAFPKMGHFNVKQLHPFWNNALITSQNLKVLLINFKHCIITWIFYKEYFIFVDILLLFYNMKFIFVWKEAMTKASSFINIA